MSKTYRVRLGTVRGADRDERSIACPTIVPEMPALLGAALAAQGWVVDAAGTKARKRFKKVDATVTLESPSLELKAEAAVAVTGRSYELDDDDAVGRARAREDAESKRGGFQAEADARAARALLDAESVVRAEVAGAVKVALLEALTRKARQLGRVESVVSGTDAEGRPVTTITVEV